MARLVDQFREALAAFADAGTSPVLIGGLALAAHKVIRATQDIDFLVASDDADRLHEVLTSLGYTCIHRSEDAANYVRGDEGLDLLYAHRPVARQFLEDARDPFEAFFELMELVEALCPSWPARRSSLQGASFRLWRTRIQSREDSPDGDRAAGLQ